MRKYIFLSVVSVALAGCSGSSSFVNTATLPDTYQCSYMKDVCKEADEFERKYEAMTPEEKKEFKTLLYTYRNQCNTALEDCKKSAKNQTEEKK